MFWEASTDSVAGFLRGYTLDNMKFAEIHRDALQRGIEQKEPEVKQLTGPDIKLVGIHNEWLKHQDTRDLINHCHKERQKWLERAVVLASSNDPEDTKIRGCLCHAKGIEIIINFINNYGQYDNNRDSIGQ